MEGREPALPETGPYVLRQLLQKIALTEDDGNTDVRISCVELWNDNLYIGTTESTLLHYVCIPPDPKDPLSQATFIQASRLEPPSLQQLGFGIQQILLLPGVQKACILTNNTLSFYSLPELSPAFPGLKPFTCTYVGGLDANLSPDEPPEGGGGVTIMINLKTKIRLVRVGEEPRRIRDIEFGGGIASIRRDNLACVADSHNYALLDVNQQAKIPLFPISSLDEEALSPAMPREALSPPPSQTHSRSISMASSSGRTIEDRGHARSSSLGIFASGSPGSRLGPTGRFGFDAPASMARTFSPQQQGSTSPETRLGTPSIETPERLASPARQSSSSTIPTARKFAPLEPHIVSPTPKEFLLTTGTSPDEPGVGMFVNLDGDVVRGTLEFTSYPEAVVVDGSGLDLSASAASIDEEEGYVLALMRRKAGDSHQAGLEVQRWDVNPGEAHAHKAWLDLSNLAAPVGSKDFGLGMRNTIQRSVVTMSQISQLLSLRLLRYGADVPIAGTAIQKREGEESVFTHRLDLVNTNIVLWSQDSIYWAVRNPLLLQLDAKLKTTESAEGSVDTPLVTDRPEIEHVLNSIRGQTPRTELEFMSLNYVRQKGSLLLFMDLIERTSENVIVFEHEKKSTEAALVEGEIDPRVILSLLPLLRDEVLQGDQGIWIPAGLTSLTSRFLSHVKVGSISTNPRGPFGDNLLQLVKRYLFVWRKKKGFGSVSDGPAVFASVDAALLHVLLILDTQSPPGPALKGSVRSELNDVVDKGVDCFDHAVELLERFQRLHVLSRLYQSRKYAAKVLETWRRILNGEPDLGGEFENGEQEFRKYLRLIRDPALVEEYGSWLAKRNPKLGAQLFADEGARVKFSSQRALELLKEHAPGAVKEYLEHLVFGKKQTQYANDLVTYYLDIVLQALTDSPSIRTNLRETSTTYRALRPPKPTYRQFIADNVPESDWAHSRLRLLQLLGSTKGAVASYDVPKILERLTPYEHELVPEMIILNGRQGRHEQSIRLLVHDLGDYDTAISYCLRGGSSIFGPAMETESPIERAEQTKLFNALLREFLAIRDEEDRTERTGELLERFGTYFDAADVLALIPEDWSVETVAAFLSSAFRRLVSERSESEIVKALCGARNLRVSEEVVDAIVEKGPVVVRGQAGEQGVV